MKQTNFLKSFFLLFALIVGSSSVWAAGTSGTINFGSGSGDLNVNSSSVSGDDNQSNTWTVTTAGTTSYTPNADYAQIGSSSKPATSITFTMTLAANQNITAFSAKFGGFNGTAGTVTLKVDNTTVGTGSLNASTDVTVTNSSSTTGKTLTVTVTGISKGVKAYFISYTYEAAKTLDNISVTTPPTKTAYKIGETVDLTGMVVTATYTDESTEDVTSKCTFSPANGATFGTAGNQNVTASYGGKEATQAITVASVTGLAVKTAPKTAYKDGEELDLSDLVLTATYSDSGTKDITNGYTSTIENGTELTTDDTSVRFTYYGQYVDQAISVGTLSSLTYNSGTFANTTYTEKDFFDPTGLVVTANYTNSIAEVVDTYTLDPDTETELTTNDDKVTASYTWAGVTKTVDIAITVNEGDKYTVTYNGGAGTPEKDSDTETEYKGGVTLPSATCSKTGWTFVGWTTSAVTATENRPATLYKSGTTFKPTSATTLYAVYKLSDYDPTQFRRVTSVDDLEYAQAVVIVNNANSYVLNHNRATSVAAPSESSSKITPAANTIFTLGGNNAAGYTLTGANGTLGVANSLPSSGSKATSWTTSNNQWIIESHEDTPNLFVLRNANSTNVALEYYSSNGGWVAYKVNTYTANTNTSMKLYVPVTSYNSNPSADVVTPDVAFGKDGTTLYLDGTTTYTNAATVTNVDKSITYESSNTDVATVSSAGEVTAVGIGTATITAKVAAELAVNTVGTDTYDVVVKNTTTVSGLKSIASSSTAVNFAADLTDAVVTYVDATSKYAYIQDASAAIMVYISGGHGLTAGKKINGAISGQVKAPYSIQQISSIDVSKATVNDGVIPAAEEKTLAYIVANAASLDGKKVLVNDATVSTGMNNATSGGVITDDGGTTTINIIAPNNLTLKATEIGNFTGFVSTYVNGLTTTYRLNLYDASQYQKTRNVETAQTLSFANNAIALDEVTSELTDFIGQAVSGAHTTVTYSKVDESSIIGDFNTETGALTLNGACGTATITATAAAGEVVKAGVTTPYLVASKSYTITVSPRYMVTFSVNGIETVLRQATSGTPIAVPTPGDLGDYKFMGWSTSTVAPTDDEPSITDLGATVTPENNNGKYYAVFAKEKNVQTPGEITSTLTLNSGTVSSPYVNNGVTWTFSGLDFVSSGNGDMPDGSTVTFTLPVTAISTVSVNAPAASGWSTKNISIALTDANNTNIATFNNGISYTFTNDNNKSSAYTLTATNQDSRKAYMNTITVVYNGLVDDISYEDYRTSLPNVEVTISESKFLSFCYGSKLDFSETDVKAYKASVDGEGKVTLTKVDVVPAGEGVVLYCETPNTYSIPVTTKDASDVTGNQMVGVLVRTQVVWNPEANVYNYILQQGQFNMATDGYLKPNRAYLSTSYDVTPSGAKALSVVFAEDETDGIRSIENSRIENSDYYNLAGQKVGADYKGIVIVNGKKYLRK